MKVLVTGATGELGRPLVARLVAAGLDVRALCRRLDAGLPPAVACVLGDVETPSTLDAAMAGVDAVVHAAAHLGDGGREPHRRVNVVGTRHVLTAAARAGVGRVVHVSTIAVHGRRDSGAVIGPDDGFDPNPELRCDYGWSKIAAERWAHCFRSEAGLPIAILRPGIVWGGRRSFLARVSRRLPGGALMVLGDPAMRLPLVHVDDVAEAIARVLRAPGVPARPLHVVGPHAPTQAEWLAAMAPGMRAVMVPATAVLCRLAAGRSPSRCRAIAYRLAWATQSVRYDTAPLAATLGWQPGIGPSGRTAPSSAPRATLALADGA